MEILVRVNTGLLRCCPRSGINACANLRGIAIFDPVNKQCDGIFGSVNTAQACRDPSGSGGGDFEGPPVRNHGCVNIDVVGVEIIGDIRVLSSPRFERFELRLWLRHVGVEIVEVTQLLRLCPGI